MRDTTILCLIMPTAETSTISHQFTEISSPPVFRSPSLGDMDVTLLPV